MQRTNAPEPDRTIVWIDVECTSLAGDDPRTLLLELAAVVTTVDLKELGRDAVILKYTPEQVAAAKWDPIARVMHETNGLLAEVLESRATVTIDEAEGRFLRLLARHAKVDLTLSPDKVGFGAEVVFAPLWGGCSPSLDRSIIRRVMPRLYERIHYRSVDATSLKLAVELWCGMKVESGPKPHRALPDALGAVNLANMMRRLLASRVAKTVAALELLESRTA